MAKKPPMQVALIVGHTQSKPGARSQVFGYEYGYNKRFADQVYWALRDKRIPALLFFKDGMEQSAVARQVNEYGRRPTMAIEFHFNAFNGKAAGTETLYDADPPEGKILAAIMQTHMCKALGREGGTDRGARLIEKGDRGHYNLSSLSVPSCLIEPFFGDNAEDCELVKQKTTELIAAIVESIQYFSDYY